MGRQTWNNDPKNWILTQKTTKNSWCHTKVASLGHGRVKPYLIISVCPVLNAISSIFFTILYVLLQNVVVLMYMILKFSTILSMKHTLQTLIFHMNTLSQWLWDHLQSKTNNRWQVITLFLLPLKKRMFVFVPGPHSIG